MRSEFPILKKTILMLVVTIIVIASYYYGHLLMRKMGVYTDINDMNWQSITLSATLFVVIFLKINGLFFVEGKRISEVIVAVMVSLVKAFVLTGLVSYLFTEKFLFRAQILPFIFQTIFISIVYCIYCYSERRNLSKKNIMVIGKNGNYDGFLKIKTVYSALYVNSVHLIYIIQDEWENSSDEYDMFIVLADVDDCYKKTIVEYCYRADKKLLIVPHIYDTLLSCSTYGNIDDIPIFTPRKMVATREQQLLKRGFDLFFSSLILVLFSPVLLLIAVMIRLESKGDILYTQVRIGQNGKEFLIYKFRSMVQGAEKDCAVLAQENDVRITKTGKIIRRIRLDELPQLFNVIRGDMSLVGPRPERPDFVTDFSARIPYYDLRHNTKPGIAGLAQVYGKYDTKPEDKLVYDLMYIQNMNVVRDFILLVQTVLVLVTKKG